MKVMQNPHQHGDPEKNIHWLPNVGLAMLAFRRALLKRCGEDPTRTPTVQELETNLKVLYLGRKFHIRRRVLRALKKRGGSKTAPAKKAPSSTPASPQITNIETLMKDTTRMSNGTITFDSMDIPYGSSAEEILDIVKGFHVIVGLEGSSFVNQLYLPLNAGLFIVQGVKNDDGQILQWHTPVAQYLGHSVINYVMPRGNSGGKPKMNSMTFA